MCRISVICAAGSGPRCPRCRPPSVSPPALTAAKTGLAVPNIAIARTDTKGEGKTDHRHPATRGASMSTERPHPSEPPPARRPNPAPNPSPAQHRLPNQPRRPVSPTASQGIRNASTRTRPTPKAAKSQLSGTHCMGCRKPLRGGSMKRKIAWAYVVSNHGPLPCEGSALPLSYTPLRVGPPYTPAIGCHAGGPTGWMGSCRPSRPVVGLDRVRRDWSRLGPTRTGKTEGGTASAGWTVTRGDRRTSRIVITDPRTYGINPLTDRSGIHREKGSPFRAGQAAQTAVTDVVLA
ncbi:exported hypothetical protein [Frankia sp. AgKG'84/4]